jgi:hypothetical protein
VMMAFFGRDEELARRQLRYALENPHLQAAMTRLIDQFSQLVADTLARARGEARANSRSRSSRRPWSGRSRPRLGCGRPGATPSCWPGCWTRPSRSSSGASGSSRRRRSGTP